jgi:hypothetical protein
MMPCLYLLNNMFCTSSSDSSGFPDDLRENQLCFFSGFNETDLHSFPKNKLATRDRNVSLMFTQ